MSYIKTLSAASIAAILSTGAMAATVGVTDGSRALVAGTTAVGDTNPNPNNAHDLGALGAGDNAEIYGRIVGSIDNFQFGFSTVTGVDVSFLFGGYDLAGGGSVAQSGFVSESTNEKTAVFSLLKESVLGSGNFDTTVASSSYTTDITSAADNGGTDNIFSVAAGTYVFSVDGTGQNNSYVGLYDIGIAAAVPLPATALLLLAGLGGLGMSRRRKA